jgi:cytochrome c biogenesis protein CcmG/thiol:disulfide interchange protein DsbE
MITALRDIAWWKWATGAAVCALLALFAAGLGRDPTYIPSPMIEKPAPSFEMAPLDGPGMVRLADYRGKALIMNFWASWCTACASEHALLVELGERLAGDDRVEVLGVDYKDTPEAAQRFLTRHGAFPYPSAIDPQGRTGIDYGVYGMPETFFIDANGRIVAKQVGPLTRETLERYLALLETRP